MAVVTQPDRPKGRGQAVSCSPVKALAVERGWPFRERIEQLRAELPTRTYEDGRSHGVGVFRWPMPFFSNEVNCSNCHVGGRAGTSGESLEQSYVGHYVTTPTPDPVDLSHLTTP